MLGVDQQQLEIVVEHVIDRLPVHAAGLHRHMRDPQLLEPVPQRQQISGHRRIPRPQILPTTPAIGHPHPRRHLRLVHVQRGGPLHHLLHRILPSVRSTIPSSAGALINQTLANVLAAQCGVPPRAPRPYCRRALGTKLSNGLSSGPRQSPAFSSVGVARQGHDYCRDMQVARGAARVGRAYGGGGA